MESSRTDKLTHEAVSAVARTLDHYRTAAEHNGYILPGKHSGLSTR